MLYINDLTIVRQSVACEKGDFMGFFSNLWKNWGKSENILPPKQTKKKKVVKKKKKTTKKKGK